MVWCLEIEPLDKLQLFLGHTLNSFDNLGGKA